MFYKLINEGILIDELFQQARGVMEHMWWGLRPVVLYVILGYLNKGKLYSDKVRHEKILFYYRHIQ